MDHAYKTYFLSPLSSSHPVVYEFQNGSDMPTLDMYLYNTTGDSHTGLHYDPVTVREVNLRSNDKENEDTEEAIPGVRRSKRKRLRKIGASNPHDEPSVFLKLKIKVCGLLLC